MLTKLSKQELLKKILDDPIFARSETHKKLLIYLVEQSLKGNIPNEIDIAIAVMEKDKHFDPSRDTLVRVYIYKLRKKLVEYYNDSGRQDAFRLTIPKGSYQVSFIRQNTEKTLTLPKQSSILNKWLTNQFLILALLIFNVWQWYTYQQTAPETVHMYSPETEKTVLPAARENMLLWKQFWNSPLKTILVFGNTFAFTEYRKDHNSYRLVHDININDKTEFEVYLNRHQLDRENYALPTWEVLAKSSIFQLARIQPLFIMQKKELGIQTSDQISWDELKQYNFIYIGHFENMQIFNQLLPSRHIQQMNTTSTGMKGIQRRLRFKNANQDTTYFFIDPELTHDSYVKDYVMMSRVPGPGNNHLMFIISFHHIGRLEVVKYLTNPVLLKTFLEQIRSISQKIPEYFEMLIEIQGYEATVLDMQIKHFYEIQQDFKIKTPIFPRETHSDLRISKSILRKK